MTGFKNYFANLESNGDGNENMAAFTTTLSGESTEDAKMATYDPDGVALGADSEGKVVLVRGIKNLGGSLRRPENKIAALVGMGAFPSGVLIKNDSFCQHVKEKAPGLEKFQKCESNEERAALTGVVKGMHDASNIFCWPLGWCKC